MQVCFTISLSPTVFLGTHHVLQHQIPSKFNVYTTRIPVKIQQHQVHISCGEQQTCVKRLIIKKNRITDALINNLIIYVQICLHIMFFFWCCFVLFTETTRQQNQVRLSRLKVGLSRGKLLKRNIQSKHLKQHVCRKEH